MGDGGENEILATTRCEERTIRQRECKKKPEEKGRDTVKVYEGLADRNLGWIGLNGFGRAGSHFGTLL
jgi:hypothetical protein